MEATPLTNVQKAAAALARSESRTARVRAELHAAIREAHEAGESVALIAQVAGLSRQAVYAIIRGNDEKGPRDG